MLWKMSAERMKCDKALTKWAMDWAASASCFLLPAPCSPCSSFASCLRAKICWWNCYEITRCSDDCDKWVVCAGPKKGNLVRFRWIFHLLIGKLNRTRVESAVFTFSLINSEFIVIIILIAFSFHHRTEPITAAQWNDKVMTNEEYCKIEFLTWLCSVVAHFGLQYK